jgi:hypothetical protein
MNIKKEIKLRTLIEVGYGLIANVGGGDWTKESSEWQEAAGRWRDEMVAEHQDVTTPCPNWFVRWFCK